VVLASGRVEEATIAAHMHIVTGKKMPLQPPNGGRRRGRLLTTSQKDLCGLHTVKKYLFKNKRTLRFRPIATRDPPPFIIIIIMDPK